MTHDVRDGRYRWLFPVAVALAAAFVGFWTAAVSYQFKLKPYFYATRAINKVVTFNPDNDFGFRTMSTLYRTQPQRKSVTFLGDSIVAFGNWDVLLPKADVDNHGIAGDTTFGLLSRIKRHEIIGKTAIVMLGVNDLKMELSREETTSNLRDIVGALKGHRILLVSTLKTGIPSTNAKLDQIVAFEKSLCAKACTYVDANRLLAPHGLLLPQYTVDGVHLSWDGYRALSSELAKELPAV